MQLVEHNIIIKNVTDIVQYGKNILPGSKMLITKSADGKYKYKNKKKIHFLLKWKHVTLLSYYICEHDWYIIKIDPQISDAMINKLLQVMHISNKENDWKCAIKYIRWLMPYLEYNYKLPLNILKNHKLYLQYKYDLESLQALLELKESVKEE